MDLSSRKQAKNQAYKTALDTHQPLDMAVVRGGDHSASKFAEYNRNDIRTARDAAAAASATAAKGLSTADGTRQTSTPKTATRVDGDKNGKSSNGQASVGGRNTEGKDGSTGTVNLNSPRLSSDKTLPPPPPPLAQTTQPSKPSAESDMMEIDNQLEVTASSASTPREHLERNGRDKRKGGGGGDGADIEVDSLWGSDDEDVLVQTTTVQQVRPSDQSKPAQSDGDTGGGPVRAGTDPRLTPVTPQLDEANKAFIFKFGQRGLSDEFLSTFLPPVSNYKNLTPEETWETPLGQVRQYQYAQSLLLFARPQEQQQQQQGQSDKRQQPSSSGGRGTPAVPTTDAGRDWGVGEMDEDELWPQEAKWDLSNVMTGLGDAGN